MIPGASTARESLTASQYIVAGSAAPAQPWNGKNSPRLRRDAPSHLQTEGETVPALIKSQGPTFEHAALRSDDRAGYSAWGSASLAQPT